MDTQAFLDWLAQVTQLGSAYQLTPDDIAALGTYGLYQQAMNQQQQYDQAQREGDLQRRQVDYQNRQLDYQMGPEMDYQNRMLDYQNQQLDFQSGPQMEYQLQQLANNAQMSADDVLKSANYLQQQRYGTEAAQMQRDIARYQAMQVLGLAPPDNAQPQLLTGRGGINDGSRGGRFAYGLTGY